MRRTIITSLLMLSLPALTFEASALNPESVTEHKAEYIPASNQVKITAKTPTRTEFDWDYTFTDEPLDHISYILIERHTPMTDWPSNAEIGRIDNPALGEVFTFFDTNVEADRKYEYRITVDVDGARSYARYAQVYTGITPGVPTAFTATVEDCNATAVDLSVTAPAVDADGNALSCRMSVIIETSDMFDRETLHTFENVNAGQTVTWRHEGLKSEHRYSYNAYALVGSAGKGLSAEAAVYVGLDVPGTPVNVTGTPEGDGLRLKWQPADRGYYGGDYNPAATTYTIKRVYNDGVTEDVVSGLADTEYLDTPDLGEMCAAHYLITPVNAAGAGYKDAVSDVFVFGQPAALPFDESFAEALFAHKGWTLDCTETDEFKRPKDWYATGYGRVYYFPTDDYLTVEPQDGDNGFATCGFDAYTPDGCSTSLISPEIATAGVHGLDLSFYYYLLPLDATNTTLGVSVSRDGADWEPLWTSPLTEGAQPGWTLKELPVALDGKTASARLKFDATYNFGAMTNMNLDKITVKVSDTDGIEDVTAGPAAEAEAVYYNLQGVRMTGVPTTPGIYVQARGAETRKVVIR